MAIRNPELECDGILSLVHRMARGDCSAIKQFYESNCDALLSFVARRINGSIEDAEEITNDIFLAAVDLGHTYDGSCTQFTWLCSLARNRIVDFQRRADAKKRIPKKLLMSIVDDPKQSFRQVHDPKVPIDELVAQVDRVRLVQSLLDTLSPDQREAVTLHYVEEFSVLEIAQIMGRSVKAVERLLEKAKEKPRREVMRWLGDEGVRAVCLEFLML